MNMGKPVIGITMGDPASVGPEIAVKTFADKKLYEKCSPLLVGDASVMQRAVELLDAGLKINAVHSVAAAQYEPGTIDVFDIAKVDIEKLQPGAVSAMAGEAAFAAVKKVIDLALAGEVDATVTGPIHKESINKAGHHFSGHTEIYAHYTNTKKYAMLLVEGNFRVIHVSTHVSLREACDKVKKERVLEVIQLLNDAVKMFGIERPRIGVAGLNPHSGDGGLFGDEEIKEIIPAIEEAKRLGIAAAGPVPSDTMFAIARGGVYDGCVAMYHDQGHIPFKMEGFVWDREKGNMKSVRGVNVTLGLPIIRTSVDHGTAFEIAGKGVASPDALGLAIDYALQLVDFRKQRD